MKYNLLFFVLLSIMSGLIIISACTRKNNPIIGAKIYSDNNHELLMQQWKSTGIRTAFISKELARDEPLKILMAKNNIPFFIIWPIFQNPEYLHHDSTQYAITNLGKRAIDDWVEFVCPSRMNYRNMVVDSIRWYVKNCHPQGVSMDFIRHFVYWEKVYPDQDPDRIENACYCDSCLINFTNLTGIGIPDTLLTVQQKAGFLKLYHNTEWNGFRSDLITSMVKAISEAVKDEDHSVKINIHIVPWREGEFNNAIINIAGQKINEMAIYADYISPMCYSQMLRRDPEWIHSVVADMDREAPGKVLPSIQVYPFYIDYQFLPEDLLKGLESSLNAPSKGVVFWSWPLLNKDPERLHLVSDYLNNHN